MSALTDKLQKDVEAKVPGELKKTYAAIVTNGKKLLWSDETHGTMKEYVSQGIKDAEDAPGVIAGGMRGVIRMLLTASKTKPDINEKFYSAAYPAAIVLMCDALEYVEAAKKIPITNDILANTTQETVAQLNTFFGIKKETIDAAMQHARQKQAQGGQPAAPATEPAAESDEPAVEPEV